MNFSVNFTLVNFGMTKNFKFEDSKNIEARLKKPYQSVSELTYFQGHWTLKSLLGWFTETDIVSWTLK